MVVEDIDTVGLDNRMAQLDSPRPASRRRRAPRNRFRMPPGALPMPGFSDGEGEGGVAGSQIAAQLVKISQG